MQAEHLQLPPQKSITAYHQAAAVHRYKAE